ncbi:MAG: A/G-specific adenine glycosylase [Enterobacterales bacterium]|nr:A/G-specific adenine glycosylase [Enterobacterales bacterium]
MTKQNPEGFSTSMLKFYDQQGRKDLPWQQNKSGYSVWVSEIMLQQTQVKTVIPYYQKFMRHFPTLQSLAEADMDQVLTLWAGLGYYSRARNLHACAKQLWHNFNGQFPQDLKTLMSLKGIGESTAGAILSLAYGKPEAILDGNVKRVLARYFLVDGWYGKTSVMQQLWQLSRQLTPKQCTGEFNQAMMDLGADICNRANPRCLVCPLKNQCRAHLEGKTAEYPHRKPTNKIPTRSADLLLIQRDQQIQLQKRPPSGIWGGLWSLPELETDKNTDFDQIGQFTHTFSHFKLQASVQSPSNKAKTSTKSFLIAENPMLAWHNLNQLHEIALPTPIKLFLQQYFKLTE